MANNDDFNANLKSALEKKKNSTPQRSDLWMVRLPNLKEHSDLTSGKTDLPSIVNARKHVSSLEYINSIGDMEELNHRVVGITAPTATFDTDDVADGNGYWFTIAHNNINNITLTIEEYQDGLSFLYFKTWQDLVKPNGSLYAPPAIWKRPIEFYRIDISKQFWLQRTIYEKCTPIEIDDVSNTYDEPEILTYNVNILTDGPDIKFQNVDNMLSSYEKQLLVTQIERKYEFSSVDQARVANIMAQLPGRIINNM